MPKFRRQSHTRGAQRHVWAESANKDGNGVPISRWCEKCGVDRTPKTEQTVCHPTRLPGF